MQTGYTGLAVRGILTVWTKTANGLEWNIKGRTIETE